MDKERSRKEVWEGLSGVAKPDSRFDNDFGSFIPDFEGSNLALDRLLNLNLYKRANLVFITPDNCLEALRAQVIVDEKRQIIATYGIRRGMVLLERGLVPEGQEEFASKLDGLERFGINVSLPEIQGMEKIDFMITGASATGMNGVRHGKGHGFFDLEWGMLRKIGVVDENTPVIAFVHDVQVVSYELEPRPYDTVADLIVTPSRVIEVNKVFPKPSEIYWDLLDEDLLESIPILSELKKIEHAL